MKEWDIPAHCEYVFTLAGNLKKHIKSKHEGVRYPCDQCDYLATASYNLKRHIVRRHEGVKYPC